MTVGQGTQLARIVCLLEAAVGDLNGIERRLSEIPVSEAPNPGGPEVRWLGDDELAGRLQHILGRQARQRGIDLS